MMMPMETSGAGGRAQQRQAHEARTTLEHQHDLLVVQLRHRIAINLADEVVFAHAGPPGCPVIVHVLHEHGTLALDPQPEPVLVPMNDDRLLYEAYAWRGRRRRRRCRGCLAVHTGHFLRQWEMRLQRQLVIGHRGSSVQFAAGCSAVVAVLSRLFKCLIGNRRTFWNFDAWNHCRLLLVCFCCGMVPALSGDRWAGQQLSAMTQQLGIAYCVRWTRVSMATSWPLGSIFCNCRRLSPRIQSQSVSICLLKLIYSIHALAHVTFAT